MTLSLHKITVRYGPVTAVAGASADLPAGQVSVVIGPNGAGKSSVLKAAAGLLPATGQVMLAGAPAGWVRASRRRHAAAAAARPRPQAGRRRGRWRHRAGPRPQNPRGSERR